MNPQQVQSGQNTESNRQHLKITQRLASIAQADRRREENMQIRERVVEIDQMLAESEKGLVSNCRS